MLFINDSMISDGFCFTIAQFLGLNRLYLSVPYKGVFLWLFACVFTEAIMRENGWTGGEIAAAGRNSWTSDRLPDAMRVANIKRRVGAQTKLRIFQHFICLSMIQ